MRVRNILIFRHECCKHSMIWAPTQYSVYYRNRQIEENRPKSTFKRTLDACCHHMKNIMSSKKRDVTALFMTSCHYDEYTVIHDIFIPASWSHPLSQLSLHHNYLSIDVLIPSYWYWCNIKLLIPAFFLALEKESTFSPRTCYLKVFL